jgi:hypothetical protein
MRLAEVAKRNRPIDRPNDLRQVDLGRCSCQHVTAANASLRSNQARPLEGEQDLLEVRRGESGPLGDVPHGCRALSITVQG